MAGVPIVISLSAVFRATFQSFPLLVPFNDPKEKSPYIQMAMSIVAAGLQHHTRAARLSVVYHIWSAGLQDGNTAPGVQAWLHLISKDRLHHDHVESASIVQNMLLACCFCFQEQQSSKAEDNTRAAFDN